MSSEAKNRREDLKGHGVVSGGNDLVAVWQNVKSKLLRLDPLISSLDSTRKQITVVEAVDSLKESILDEMRSLGESIKSDLVSIKESLEFVKCAVEFSRMELTGRTNVENRALEVGTLRTDTKLEKPILENNDMYNMSKALSDDFSKLKPSMSRECNTEFSGNGGQEGLKAPVSEVHFATKPLETHEDKIVEDPGKSQSELLQTSDEVHVVAKPLDTLGEDKDVEDPDKSQPELLQTSDEVLVAEKPLDRLGEDEDVEDPGKSQSELLQPSDEVLLEEIKTESIDAMMRKTGILGEDEVKVAHVRSLYEKLYSVSPLTSILTRFLRFYPRVIFRADCESGVIGRLRAKLTDYDGLEWDGDKWRSFAFLDEELVCFGALTDGSEPWMTEEGVIATLASSLCVLCCHLMFRNKGLPYYERDVETEDHYSLLVEEGTRRGKEAWLFAWAMGRLTREAKLIHMISRVPRAIAYYGSAKGTSMLKGQLASMLEFYERNVVAILTEAWEVKRAVLGD